MVDIPRILNLFPLKKGSHDHEILNHTIYRQTQERVLIISIMLPRWLLFTQATVDHKCCQSYINSLDSTKHFQKALVSVSNSQLNSCKELENMSKKCLLCIGMLFNKVKILLLSPSHQNSCIYVMGFIVLKNNDFLQNY